MTARLLIALVLLLVGCRSADPPKAMKRVATFIPTTQADLVNDAGEALMTLVVTRPNGQELEVVLTAKDVAVPQVSVQLTLAGPSERSEHQLLWFGDMQPGATATLKTKIGRRLSTIFGIRAIQAETGLGPLSAEVYTGED